MKMIFTGLTLLTLAALLLHAAWVGKINVVTLALAFSAWITERLSRSESKSESESQITPPPTLTLTPTPSLTSKN